MPLQPVAAGLVSGLFRAGLLMVLAAQAGAGPALGDDCTGCHGEGPVAHSGEAPCVTCHDDMAILPQGHVPIAGMPLEKCESCHAADGPIPLVAGLNLDHGHYIAGLACADCHARDAPKAAPEMGVCTGCHGDPAALAKVTADLPDANPHASPHGAPFTQCALCHRQHQPSENFCATCHDFDFKVP